MLHKNSALGDQHLAHNWEFADATARTSATGFVTADLKKLALQLSDNTFWVLTAVTPTWVQVGGGGGGSAAWGGITGTLASQTDLAAALAGKQAADELLTSGGSANAQTLTPTTPITSYASAVGRIFMFSAGFTNTTATPTINISGKGALNTTMGVNTPPAGGIIAGNVYFALIESATSIRIAPFDAMSVNGDTLMGRVDFFKGANIASAATLDLTTATGNLVHITGTTTITAVTINLNQRLTLIFDGALTLTNGSSLVLPGGANIVTGAGDRCEVWGDGANVANVVSFTRATGTPAMLDVAQTFTKPQKAGAYSLTSSTAWDGTLYQHLTATVNGGTFTIANPSAHTDGVIYLVRVAYTTSNSIAWGNQFKGLTGITATATAGAEDVFTFRSNGTNLVRCGYSLNGAA